MKKLFLIFNLFYGTTFLFSQNTDSISLRKTKFISFSPKKNLSDNVNGINVGVLDAYDGQKINGFNLQFNPIVIIYPLLPKAIPAPEKDNGSVVINGLHLSTSGTTDAKEVNGVGVSMYHHAFATNGISVNFYNNTSKNLNGIHISGFSNNTDVGNGLNVAFLGNYAENFNGLQIGLSNDAENLKGLQVGLFNRTNKMKGLQIGFWNKNGKRSLPIINF